MRHSSTLYVGLDVHQESIAPTDISRINRRGLLAPPLPMTQVNGIKKMEKNQ